MISNNHYMFRFSKIYLILIPDYWISTTNCFSNHHNLFRFSIIFRIHVNPGMLRTPTERRILSNLHDKNMYIPEYAFGVGVVAWNTPSRAVCCRTYPDGRLACGGLVAERCCCHCCRRTESLFDQVMHIGIFIFACAERGVQRDRCGRQTVKVCVCG